MITVEAYRLLAKLLGRVEYAKRAYFAEQIQRCNIILLISSKRGILFKNPSLNKIQWFSQYRMLFSITN